MYTLPGLSLHVDDHVDNNKTQLCSLTHWPVMLIEKFNLEYADLARIPTRRSWDGGMLAKSADIGLF